MHGRTLRHMRLEIGWTQQILAEVLEITRSSLAHYETGRASIPRLIDRKITVLHGGIINAMEKSRKL